MKIESISIQNYGPYVGVKDIRLGSLTTIVGQNDVGKSYVLKGLNAFLESGKIEKSDISSKASTGDEVSIEIAFSSIPERVEIESGVETTLGEEMLLDGKGNLRVKKVFNFDDPTKFSLYLIVSDYSDEQFSNLCIKKERDLNELGQNLGIQFGKSGRGITNRDKRNEIRQSASQRNIPTSQMQLEVDARTDLARLISKLLPKMILFEAETRVGVDETSFQGQFKQIVRAAVNSSDLKTAQESFAKVVQNELQKEIDGIFEYLKRHTNSFTKLVADPIVSWDKAVSFDVLGGDRDGVVQSISQRGSGLRRLLMVSAFQYLAQKDKDGSESYLLAVEEPENCLHPGLQRELSESFKKLAESGYQILITSHSPVFAGSANIQDIILIQRTDGVSSIVQSPKLDPAEIATELGVEPADQITGYSACVFVEGKGDMLFWSTLAKKFKEGGFVSTDFEDSGIGLIITGGDNLKHLITERAMSRLNRRFCVIVDSDKKSSSDSIPRTKINWKKSCQEQGGQFIILRKREIENYLHPKAIDEFRHTKSAAYDDYTDMKKLFGDAIIKAVRNMSAAEILERDSYTENGTQHHELLDIVKLLLSLPKHS